jgi:hypothetical protein
MIDDKTLLELAAKAANYGLYESPNDATGRVMIWRDGRIVEFNSLADDGDALRLAARLKLCIDTGCELFNGYDKDCNWIKSPAVCVWKSSGTPVRVDEKYGDDEAGAIRRAITRAAVALADPTKGQA